jgi:hypothetical protein
VDGSHGGRGKKVKDKGIKPSQLCKKKGIENTEEEAQRRAKTEKVKKGQG